MYTKKYTCQAFAPLTGTDVKAAKSNNIPPAACRRNPGVVVPLSLSPSAAARSHKLSSQVEWIQLSGVTLGGGVVDVLQLCGLFVRLWRLLWDVIQAELREKGGHLTIPKNIIGNIITFPSTQRH